MSFQGGVRADANLSAALGVGSSANSTPKTRGCLGRDTHWCSRDHQSAKPPGKGCTQGGGLRHPEGASQFAPVRLHSAV